LKIWGKQEIILLKLASWQQPHCKKSWFANRKEHFEAEGLSVKQSQNNFMG
jgi:hypothetical protein